MANAPWEQQLTIRGGKKFALLDIRDRRFLAWVAPKLATKIKDRLQGHGTDVRDRPLPPYSDKYLKLKKRTGRYRGFVDYTLKGDLFNHIAINYLGKWDALKLYFKGTHGDIRAQHLADRLADRLGKGNWVRTRGQNAVTWFGISGRDEMFVEDEFEKRVINPKMAGLPAAVDDKDIPPKLRRYVKIEK